MPTYYCAELLSHDEGVATIAISFGEAGTNDRIVPAALAAVQALGLPGGQGIRFHGPASLPVAMALAHAVAHLYGWVACWDPKLSAYVVAISHTPAVRPGDLLPG